MKHLTVSLLLLFCAAAAYSQSFSNKGTDFWITYPVHIDGATSIMGIYITSDVNATGTITVNGTSVPFTITANTITEKFIGSSLAADASNSYVYLTQTDGIKTGAAIHVVSNNPVVVYAHIIHSARSGATLVLPSNVWGRAYVVPSYKSFGTGTGQGYGTITVVAADTNTVVQITPAASSYNGSRTIGTPYTITLANPGDVYQVQFQQNADISGTTVQSISTGSGCKKIAVFSSTTWSAFGCNTAGSGDNLFQQLFPTGAWGKTFLTAPAKTRVSDLIRVFVSDPTAVVTKTENGITTTLSGLVNSTYYEYQTGNATYIQSTKPASVVQYFTTMACQNGATIGDPEMIVINPVEQTINNITVFSPHQNYINNKFAGQSNITNCYLNIIIPTVSAPSFKINGNAPPGSFSVIPGTTYSYLQADVTSLTLSNPVQNLKADSNFSAIAYGFGNVESYGYNAGTNVIDLSQGILLQNPYVVTKAQATCTGTPFNFAVKFAYQPTSITWDFGNNPNQSPNATVGPIANPAGLVADSTFIDNASGKTIYVYKLPGSYSFTASGAYNVTVTSNNPTSDGCSGVQQQTYTVTVYSPPVANFGLVTSGCLTDSVRFLDSSNASPRTLLKWKWDFNDGTLDSIQNPIKKFAATGVYNIKLRAINDLGCYSDTVKTLTISAQPVAKFGVSDTSCINTPLTFTDSSSIASGSILKWYWDYGNGKKDTLAATSTRIQTYSSIAADTISLKIQSSTGCNSLPFTKIIHINPLPVPNFTLPTVCLPVGAAQFNDLTTISDNTNNFKYKWNFGDGGTDTAKNPLHNYTSVGPFNIKLTATSLAGCQKDTTLALNTVYARPHAAFSVNTEVCLRDTTILIDSSDGKGSSVVKWRWSFGDGGVDTIQNPKHLYTTAGTDSVKLYIYTDKGCISDTTVKATVVNPLPVAGFSNASILCETRQISFTDTSKAQVGTITAWNWNMGNGDILNPTSNAAFNETYAAAGNYSVRLAVQNSKGCKSDTLVKSITVHALPQVGFISPEVCLNDASAQFNDTTKISDGSQALFTYSWNFNAGTPAISPGPTPIGSTTVKNPSARYFKAANYQVALTVTSKDGCVVTGTQPFTVNGASPHASITILDSTRLCSNTLVRLQDSSTVDFGGVTMVEIFWDNIGAPTADSIDQNPAIGKIYTHQYPALQTTKKYEIRFVAHSGNASSCSNTLRYTVTVHQSPKVQFTTLPGICADTTARQITQASEIGGVPGTFYYTGTGVSAAGIFTPQSVAAGTYPIKYIDSTSFGCRDSATQNMIVWPSPVAKWGVSSPDCEKNNITFTDSSVANYSKVVSWFWNFGDGNLATKTSGASFTKQYASANTYSASLRVMTDSGCRSTYVTKAILVNYLPKVNFGLPSICLPDGRGTFTDSSTITDGSQNLFSYLWNFGDANDPTASTLKNPVHKYSAVGPYTVKLQVTTKDGCIDSSVQQLTTLYPPPVAGFTIQPPEVCVGDSIHFIDTSNGITGPVNAWVWDLANGTTSSLQNPVKKFVDSGTFNISLHVFSGQTCISTTVVQQVIIHPYPVLSLDSIIHVLQGGTATIKPVYYGHSLQFLWTPATYLNSDTAINPKSTPPADIIYTLTLTGLGNCSVKDSILIKVLKDPEIPNAFSPNGDGVNDTWRIKYLESYPGATISVFNRYGQMVFNEVGYNKDWDGTYNGRPLPIGTYYYIIDPKNGKKIFSGAVTIIR